MIQHNEPSVRFMGSKDVAAKELNEMEDKGGTFITINNVYF